MKRRGSSSLPAAHMDITEDHGGVGEAAIAFRELGGRKNRTGDVEVTREWPSTLSLFYLVIRLSLFVSFRILSFQ